MSETAERLKIEIANLSAEEREELAEFVWNTLDNGHADESSELGSEWEAELERRWEDICSGKVEGIPGDEVFAKLRAKYQ